MNRPLTPEQTKRLPIERQLAMMVQDAHEAILNTTATVQRDIGVNRVTVEVCRGNNTWTLNGKQVEVRDVVRILTDAPNVRAFSGPQEVER
jgi:hypothetical protein